MLNRVCAVVNRECSIRCGSGEVELNSGSCSRTNTAYNVVYPKTRAITNQALSQHVAETLSVLNVNEARSL